MENSPSTAESASEFVISRVFDAPRELVFKAWTDPRHMARWWGPRDFTNPVCELDARPGGAHRIVMRSPDGIEFPCKGIYREVSEPERLVMTLDCSEHPDFWHDLVNPSRRKGDKNPVGEMLSTITFEDLGGRTRLTVRTRFESAAIRDAMLKMGMTEGWSQSLDRLTDILAAGTRTGGVKSDPPAVAAEGEFSMTRVFNASRALVFKAWTEAERLKHWWGPKGFSFVAAKVDLRPGGLFHYCMRAPDGREMWGKFVYREIVAPERLVFVVSFSDLNGATLRNPFNPDWPAEVLNTLSFSENEGKTTIAMRGSPFNASESEKRTFAAHHGSMQQGFAGTLGQLDGYLARVTGALPGQDKTP
jgi:uncharacterized protein YndB with AHSA1/START domain